MMIKKVIWIWLIILILIVVAIVLIKSQTKPDEDSDKLQVTASFYSLAEFARQIGGDKIKVITLTPTGVEPHEFSPTPQDRVRIQQSRVFIYNGAGLEPWAEKILSDLTSTKAINGSENLALLLASGQENSDDQTIDPHYWLDPVLVQSVVDRIAKIFTEVDSANADYYLQRSNAYKTELMSLNQEYQTVLSSCQSRDIVTAHTAFAYLATRYNLNQVAIAGLTEEEPSPKRLAEIAKYVKDHNIETIFVESLTDPRLSETIAAETGAKTATLNPIEGLTENEIREGEDYLSVMRTNLQTLRVALKCQ